MNLSKSKATSIQKTIKILKRKLVDQRLVDIISHAFEYTSSKCLSNTGGSCWHIASV